MLTTVFRKLAIFAFYFLMVIGAFTILIDIVAKNVGSAQQGLDRAYLFIMALRQSIGDGDTSTLIDKSELEYRIITWIVWFIIQIVGNVVFMNFIIAVVNEGYAECINVRMQSIQMAKLQMIEECESFLPSFMFKNDKLFPRFIIHRRELNQNI